MKLFKIVLMFCFFISTSFAGEFQGAKIYELNSDRKKLLFTMHAKLDYLKTDEKIFTSHYVDNDSKEVLTEEATFNKLILQKYIIQQKQLNETYELDITNNKMYYSVTRKGKTQKQTRELPKNLVIGPTFVPFIQQHWSELQLGTTVKFELAVLDRMNTYSFEFTKIREEKFNDKNAVVIRMHATNLFVLSVVRPTYFIVNNDGSQILDIKGRMLPRKKNGPNYSDLDAEAVFTY